MTVAHHSASEQAEAEWVATVVEMADRTSEFSENCTPGYYNNEGQPGKASRQNFFYFGGPTEFVDILESWRADGEMKGLEISKEADPRGRPTRSEP